VAIRTAARLAPGTKAAYNHATVAFQNGHVHEALEAIEALPADRGPMRGFASYWSLYGSIAHALGDYGRERKLGEAARAAYPSRLIALPPLLRAYATSGDTRAIDRTLDSARLLPPDPYFWDYGLLVNEAAEELRAHGHASDAEWYWKSLDLWLAARDTTPAIRWRRVQALRSLGALDSAARLLESLRRDAPENPDYLGMAGIIAARRGDRVAATAIADSLANRHRAYDFGAGTLARARIAALTGDSTSAIRLLEQALGSGQPYQLWLHRDVDFESMRGQPAFARILAGKD
jgi:predicted Zn-dependent protease